MDTYMRTTVWRLTGLTGSEPAILEMAAGRLSLSAESGAGFDAALGELESVRFPWYYFGGGCKVVVGGEEHRISFVRPNGAADLSGRLIAAQGGVLGGAAALGVAGSKLMDVGTGRRAGKAWKEALAQR